MYGYAELLADVGMPQIYLYLCWDHADLAPHFLFSSHSHSFLASVFGQMVHHQHHLPCILNILKPSVDQRCFVVNGCNVNTESTGCIQWIGKVKMYMKQIIPGDCSHLAKGYWTGSYSSTVVLHFCCLGLCSLAVDHFCLVCLK